MGHLHELLPIETQLEGQRKRVLSDLRETFTKKQHHFRASMKLWLPPGEDAKEVTEEQVDLQTTVPQELTWICPHIAKSWDASLGVAVANTVAFSDITLEDGTVLASKVPATALLELEKYIQEVMSLINAIPTLDPEKGFTPSLGRPHTYAAREISKQRTKKGRKVYTLAKATDKHPEQAQLVDEDLPHGTIRELAWSGMLTPMQKTELLSRVENLLCAVKKARSRANSTEVPKYDKIGDRLLSYIFGDLKSAPTVQATTQPAKAA